MVWSSHSNIIYYIPAFQVRSRPTIPFPGLACWLKRELRQRIAIQPRFAIWTTHLSTMYALSCIIFLRSSCKTRSNIIWHMTVYYDIYIYIHTQNYIHIIYNQICIYTRIINDYPHMFLTCENTLNHSLRLLTMDRKVPGPRVRIVTSPYLPPISTIDAIDL